ncbi:MAG: hypothetical protein HQM09_07945 [Candidatus Riflebacteria bacterium]|nr:hypothetical protein [Candidatus Riflebacteria bacterium]
MMFRSLLFIGLACLFSWPSLWWYLDRGGIPGTLTWYGTLVAFSAGPALAAWLLQRLWNGKPFSDLGVSFSPNRWFAIAWLAPALLGSAAIRLSLFLGSGTFDTSPNWLIERLRETLPHELLEEASVRILHSPDPSVLLAGVTTIFGALLAGIFVTGAVSLLEESGWRGFLHLELRSLGPWKGAFATGLGVAVWQAPLAWYGGLLPGHSGIAICLSALCAILIAPALFMLREASGSIIAVSLFQGTFNALGALFLFVRGTPFWLSDRRGLAMLLTLLIVNLAIAVFQALNNLRAVQLTPQPSNQKKSKDSAKKTKTAV